MLWITATLGTLAQQWLAFYQRFWDERLDSLDALLTSRRKPR